MKEKISVLLLALVLLVMASCAPSGTAKGDAARQPEPLNALKTETSDFAVIQPDTAYTPNNIRFDSKLGCSLTYDPIFFEAEDVEDEYLKSQSIESVVCLSVQSIWKNGVFPICVTIEPLNASSVEEAIINDISIRNLDGPGEETTFGTGSYTATHFTFNKAYAVGDIYVTEQNGAIFTVEVSSYYQPPKKELALAYAVLDSIIF